MSVWFCLYECIMMFMLVWIIENVFVYLFCLPTCLSSAYVSVSVYFVWIFLPHSNFCMSEPSFFFFFFFFFLFFFFFFQGDDCDEEDFCAISPNWTYDRRTRRWRRLKSTADVLLLSDSPAGPQDVSLCDVSDHHDVCSIHSSSSTESEGHDRKHKSHRDAATTSATATASTTDDQETSRSSSRCSSSNKTSLDTSFSGPPSPCGSGGGSSSMIQEAEGCFPDKPPRKKGTSLLKKMERLRLRGSTGLLAPAHSGGSSSRSHRAVSRPVLGPEEERMERLHCPARWGLWVVIFQKQRWSFNSFAAVSRTIRDDKMI